MATAPQIQAYLEDILYAQSVYMDDVNLRERLGHEDTFKYKIRNTILGYYVEIMIDFFSQSDYDLNNFFTVDEVKDIMNRINRLCDSNYNLDL
jgi:hypothetical protein